MPRYRMSLTMLGLYLLSAAQIGWCQEGQELPVWEPAEERLKRLAPEFESESGDWAIRPPIDYPHRVNQGGNETRTTWGKQSEGVLIVIQSDVAAGQTTLEEGLERYVDTLKGRAQKFRHTPFERGRVDGKLFIRTRFSAEGLPGIAGLGYGFVYWTFDGRIPLGVTGFGTETTIEDLEAAALTFRVVR